MVTYCLQDLNAKDVRIYAQKELTDGTLAAYHDSSEVIVVNAIYLATCTYRNAIHVAAHECYHRKEHDIINAIDILEEMGIDTNNDYFKEALLLKEANERYSKDSQEYDTYKSNLLEVKSEEYAFMIEKQLEEKGYLR